MVKEKKRAAEDIIDAMGDGLVLLTVDGKITSINPAFEKMSGYKKSELVGKDATELISKLLKPEDMKKVMDGLRTALKGKVPPSPSVPLTLITKDGREIPVISTTSFMKDAEGKPTTIIFTTRDITELKRTEEKLKKEKDFSETLIRKNPFGFMLVNSKREIIDINSAALRIIGREKDEVIGKICHKFVCPAEKNSCPVFDLGQKVDHSERIALSSNGQKIPILKSVIPIELEGKKCLIETFSDIIELKRAEGALRESEERYRRLVETMNEGLDILDENGLFIYVNDKFCKMLGYSRDELIGRPILDFVDKSNQNIAKEQLDRQRKGEHVSYELARTGKDGRKIFTITSASPIFDADGHFKGSFAVVTDITERKRVEEVRAKAAVIEAMGDGLILLTMDGKIASVNPAFEKMICYEKSELVEKDIADVTSKLVKSGDLKKTMRTLGTALEGKVPASLTVTFVPKDGREIPVTFTISFIKDARGKPTTIIVNIKDITEFKRLEDERAKADRERIEELEKFTKIAVGRELRMVELKKRIKEMEERLKNVSP